MRDKEKVKEYSRRYKEKHRDEIRERKRRWRQSENGKISVSNYNKRYKMENKDKIHEYRISHYYEDTEKSVNHSKKYQAGLRQKFFDMYGNSCACCGESLKEFLTLEHKQGQRGLEKRDNCATAYRKAIKEYRPDLYEVLCYNCNLSKGRYGYCPHTVMPEHVSP